MKRARANDEELYFHELIHVVQWHLLGPERFIALYADGLKRLGYYDSPLEQMAYLAEKDFARLKQPFDAEALVQRELQEFSAV